MFTKQKFTNTLCLQNKTNVCIQVMFIKQVIFTKQNTKQKFTNTLCLQNKNKTKVYIQVMFIKQVRFTKQNTKEKFITQMFTKQNKSLQHVMLTK